MQIRKVAETGDSMAALAQETANKLLDFSQKLDIGLLVSDHDKSGNFSNFLNLTHPQDNVVTAMYASSGTEQKMAEEVLTTLKEHPDAWTKVDTILEFSTNQQTKYYALQILESVIKTRWKVLPRNQCEGIKK